LIGKKRGVHPPFKFGDKILVSGFVENDPDGLYKVHVDADGRLADNFYLATVPQLDLLQEYSGMPLEVIVDIIDERKSKWQISNIQNYDAKLVEIVSKPLINPTREQIADLEMGKRVVVKGRFVKFGESGKDRFLKSLGYPEGTRIAGECSTRREAKLTLALPDGKEVERTVYYPPRDYNDNSTLGIVEAEEGRRIGIDMPTGRVSFSGGVLECLTKGSSNANKRKSPEEGDYVRIGAFVNRRGGLSVHGCEPCVLDKPSEKRQRAYSELREKVGGNIEEIETLIGQGRYSDVRELIGHTRTLELTSEELEKTRDVTQSMFESERPVQSLIRDSNREGRRDSYVEYIDRAYEVYLESMTRDEFIEFSRTAVTGDRKQTGKHCDTSYLFFLSDLFGMDTETRESLITDCIKTRLGKIRGKPYNHDRDWDDKYNIDQGLSYLAGVGTESSANRLFSYLRSFVKQGDFYELGWREQDRNQRPEAFLFPVIQAISCHITEIPKDIVERELPYLRHLSEYLRVHADEPVTLDVLNRTIDYVEKNLSE